ncbi:MAG: 6-pyruvoyl-tetrahydropterin synthase-related protein, partial [Acidobacteriota bacterium]
MKSVLLSGMFFAPTSNEAKRDTVSSQKINQDLRFAFIVAAVGVAVLLPIVILGIPNGADLPNHFCFAQPFYEAVQSGHWYPGWLAESNDGFGDPRFRFYPPGLYYLLSAARALTGGWYSGTIAVAVFLSVTGGLGAYFWARTLCQPKLAMWAGLLYTIAPYHLNELYQASLLSEYAACSILPFAFAFVERICRKRSIGDLCGLAVSIALLILTHLPLAVIGSISLGLYAALRLERKRILSTIAHLVGGVLLGLAASAFFWATMLAELPWIK